MSSVVVTVDPLILTLVPEFLRLRREDVAQIARQLDEGDLAPVQRIGHNMKGNGAAYGFAEISRLGAELEIAGRDGDRDAVVRLRAELDAYLDAVQVEARE